jgi:hypothetical protein
MSIILRVNSRSADVRPRRVSGGIPGILLDPPDLRDDLAVAGKCLFGNGGHRLNVIERAIGVEHNGFDGHVRSSSG